MNDARGSLHEETQDPFGHRVVTFMEGQMIR